MKLGCGYPLGPFELGDLVGLDTAKNIYFGKLTHRAQAFHIRLVGWLK